MVHNLWQSPIGRAALKKLGRVAFVLVVSYAIFDLVFYLSDSLPLVLRLPEDLALVPSIAVGLLFAYTGCVGVMWPSRVEMWGKMQARGNVEAKPDDEVPAAAMTDREKAFSINGYVGFMKLKTECTPGEAGQLAIAAAKQAGIPVELVARAQDESDAFLKIVMLALRWRTIWRRVGRWSARRAVEKAQTSAFSMTDREKALVLDGMGKQAEVRFFLTPPFLDFKMSHSKAAELVARSAWLMGIEYKFVAQLSQESTDFLSELLAE